MTKPTRPLRIGICCYPSVGGSGILATSLGTQLAKRGHEVHFISYGRPFRLPVDVPSVYFHSVEINTYELFRYPDYTLPLSVKMVEVSRTYSLDILHVHYAVPHATAAILAREMLGRNLAPKIITTLHGTDTTLLGKDPAYAPAIRFALEQSNAVTAVSKFLRDETHRSLGINKEIAVIHNFFEPSPPKRTRAEVRRELGIEEDERLIIHSSNLRPVKRIDLLLETAALVAKDSCAKFLILAGGDFTPHLADLSRLGIQDRVQIRQQIIDIEEYFQAADIALSTSDSESFCLSLLEGMAFGCPSISTRVGGVKELVEHGVGGYLSPAGNAKELAVNLNHLIHDIDLYQSMSQAARARAQNLFSSNKIVPQYEALYSQSIALP